MSKNSSNFVYFEGIDFLKGILIILVILGHVIQSLPSDILIRRMITTIHMPMFLAVSGFLIKEDKLLKNNSRELVKKYFFRLLLPWIIAMILYFIYLNFDVIINNEVTLELVQMAILLPVSALWYTPVLFFFIIFIWYFKKKQYQDFKLLIIAILLIIVIFWWVNFYYFPKVGNRTYDDIMTFKLVKKYRPQYFIFFILGYLIRNREITPKIKKIIKTLSYFIIPLYIFNLYVYFVIYNEFTWYNTIPTFFFLNICLIPFILLKMSNWRFQRWKSLKWLGKNVQPVYLYHVLILLISIDYLLGNMNVYLWFVMTLFLIFILIIVIYIFDRIDNRFIKLAFFGEI